MESSKTRQVEKILKSIMLNRTLGFAGIGIVFYQDLKEVPHLSMGHPSEIRPNLPVKTIKDIVSTLTSVADISSAWHDGFHFINSNDFSLTHLSQFISPSLLMYESTHLCNRPSGARHMTAALVSKSFGIDCVGLLSLNGEICIFRDGVMENKVFV